MLRNSKKYRDLYKTIEGRVSILSSVVLSCFIARYLVAKPVEDINDFLMNISLIFIPCLIALLGITFTGLAFVSGTVSLKATKNLLKKNKIQSLISIFFTFYFLGWIIAITIFLYIVVFIAAISDFVINFWTAFIISLLIIYFTLFIILYSVGLFDTCIKIFFVNYKYNEDDNDN